MSEITASSRSPGKGPQLHHCVVILFWSLGNVVCMLFTFENKSSAHSLGGDNGVAFFIDEQLQQN